MPVEKKTPYISSSFQKEGVAVGVADVLGLYEKGAASLETGFRFREVIPGEGVLPIDVVRKKYDDIWPPGIVEIRTAAGSAVSYQARSSSSQRLRGLEGLT